MLKTAPLPALKLQLKELIAQRIHELFGIHHEPWVEVPPRRSLGDLAFPAGLHLAKQLKQKPREIAATIAAGLVWPPAVLQARIEGAGYLNVFLARSAFAGQLLAAKAPADPEPVPPTVVPAGKVIVEHTNINPNKAAHIGHLRNAVLGDVLARALAHLGFPVEVQNYIDDTGVQLADVVVGCIDLRALTWADVDALPEPFDYFCWDLYSEVGRFYEADPERLALRRETLHALEQDRGPRALMGRLIAQRVVRRHLATMARLGITYDLLTHESDILHLEFFARAFAQLKASGAIILEEAGKNRGCWVMPLAQSAEFAGLEDPDKVIVRSDGTVTYVGKDIAYQLWKFGLLGCDFAYREGPELGLWETTAKDGAAVHPPFGGATRVINVIDARQSYLQKIVRAGLAALGHAEPAANSTHFAYEMVSLSRATAQQLGFLDADDDRGKNDGGKSLEMSGRKGIGVKADDLLDQVEAKCCANVSARHPDLDPAAVAALAHPIAVAAIRFFMVKATTTRGIAFDLDEALSFEGETGPYLQYSQVRQRNICRRLAAANLATAVSADEVRALAPELWADDLWDLVLSVAQTSEVVEKAVETLELSLIARHALELAQKFHAVYHRHPILNEPQPELRAVRLAATQIFADGLAAILALLGIEVPERM